MLEVLGASHDERLSVSWERVARRVEAGGLMWSWGRSRTVVCWLCLVLALE